MTSQLPLFALRAPRDTHLRLKAAARADGLTMAEELDRLLDLREIYDRQTRPPHPLAQPPPLPSQPPNTNGC